VNRNCLIIFTRYPQPGTAKTRLIPALGAEGAADLQRQMTEQTLAQVEQLRVRYPCLVEIWFAGSGDEDADQQRMQSWLGSSWRYRAQVGQDLGERLIQATGAAFTAGMQRVVVIGTDCPDLSSALMQQAFQRLDQHDLVLGPATDGGYYLIGLRQFIPWLFQQIAWSSEIVLQQTVEAAVEQGLTIAYLEPLTDIDRPNDLPIWQRVQAEMRAAKQSELSRDPQPRLSVIIPVLNEANLPKLVQAVQQAAAPEAIEVIVVDGGSSDLALDLAGTMGVTLLQTAPGRATQMNAGAEIAQGDILLFLHADTRLPTGFAALVSQALAQPNTIAGAFELQIAGPQTGLRWVEWGVKWRSRWLQLPYGDQALFLKAATFKQLNGFADLPIMEDFELVCRLQACGKIAILPVTVITSGRRWQRLGVLQTTLINQLMIAGYFLGVPLDQLARWYRSGVRQKQAKTNRS
jgi:rSAM/selenodomain-associated transferase 2/rSAM/selenodomain-associated transferase 1